MGIFDYKQNTANAVKIADALTINRKSPEYKLGLAQLNEWNERCRAKRLCIKRKTNGTHSVSAACHSYRMAKGGAE